MDEKNFGTFATCGVNGTEITVSSYNVMCPCLNCVGCDKTPQCQWRHVLETNPCTNEDMRAVMCQKCMNQKERE